MKTVDEIVNLWNERVQRLGPVHSRIREVRRIADADIILPLNELDRNARASVANLLLQGLDQMSARVASVIPHPYFAPLKPSERARQDARTRRNTILSWWDRNQLDLKLSYRARHLLAYSFSPVIVEPCFKRMIPKWRVHNPLDVFPAAMDQPDDMWPDNVIIAWEVTTRWLLREHPEQARRLPMRDNQPDDRWHVLRYIDDQESVLCVAGTANPPTDIRSHWPATSHSVAVELSRTPNRAGVPLMVIPQRITLNQPRGQFDGMMNMYYTRARLQALNEIAIERGIFPNEWLIARPGEHPEVIVNADGRQGIVGVVKGGIIEKMEVNPGYKTDTALDRLERQERVEGAIPPEFAGESGSNIRTGRRGDSILSATIDYRVMEAQRLFEKSLTVEDRIAVAVDKAYWGSIPKSFLMPGRAPETKVDYIPNRLWESDEHVVTYPAAGSDINNLVIGLGQRIGTGIMSKETARESDPLISDPELEKDRIVREGLEAAFLASIQQQAADPNGPYQPRDLAAIVRKVLDENKPLFQAVEEVDMEARQRQATQLPEGDPMTQPGLATPGMGAEAPEAVPPVERSVANLGTMLSQLRRPVAVANSMSGG